MRSTRWRDRLPHSARGAWSAWLAFAVVISALVTYQPERAVTHNYRDACGNWFAGRPLYSDGVHGFLYFPHAAILYAPFTLPSPLGGILWRWVSIGGLALSVWRLAGLVAPQQSRAAFAVMTCLALPPALPSARNGQMNLMLTALVTLAFSEIAERRWRRAACWLCLGAALKPLMIVPMAVAAVAYRPLWRPLMGGAVILFLLPFFTQHPEYVCQQYRQCVHKLFLAGNPGFENPGSDLFGLLSSMSYIAPLPVQTATRVAAGAATLLLAMFATVGSERKRVTANDKETSGQGDKARETRIFLEAVVAPRAAITVLALAVCYLALFNPRMENNGYVLLGPVMGGRAAEALLLRPCRLVVALMVAASLGITFSYQITGGHNFWVCPLMGTMVWLCTIIDVGRKPAAELALGSALADVAS